MTPSKSMTKRLLLFILVAGAVAGTDRVARAATCSTDGDCLGLGETCVSGSCSARSCGGPSDCSSSENCFRGVCVQTCGGSGATCPGEQECIFQNGSLNVPLCMPAISLQWPSDYGLADGDRQPSCGGAADCSPTLICVGGECRGDGCGDATFKTDFRCPPFASQTCQLRDVMSGEQAFCVVPTTSACTADADCTADPGPYPIHGYDCLEGRCTNSCTSDADCTRAGPSGKEQRSCFQSRSGGRCVKSVGSAKLILYDVHQPDVTKAKVNIVFVSEGYTPDKLDIFERYVTYAMEYTRKHSDMEAPLFSGSFNFFVLELPESHFELGHGTVFGRFKSFLDVAEEMPGANDQAAFALNHAVSTFSVRAATYFGGAAGGPFTPAGVHNFVHGVIAYRSGDSHARASSGAQVFMLIGDGVGAPQLSPNLTSDSYFVLQHEFGHAFGSLSDEYDSDSGALKAGDKPGLFCTWDIVSRQNLTGCSICDGSDDMMSLAAGQANAPWSQFLTESTFPSSNSSNDAVGLYEGAGRFWKKGALRSQRDCTMRQGGGNQNFCAASREGFINQNLADTDAGSARWVSLGGNASQPSNVGNGPLRAVAVNSNLHKTYVTAEYLAGRFIAVIEHNPMNWMRDISLPAAAGTSLSRFAIQDPASNRLFLDNRNFDDEEQSGLLVLDMTSDTLQTPLSVPALDGVPIFVPGVGRLYGYRRSATVAGEIAAIDPGGAPLRTVAPAPLPVLNGEAQLSVNACPAGTPCSGLVFFTAHPTVPANSSCNDTSCEIWIFDPDTESFLPDHLVVDTTGATVPGIGVVRVAAAKRNGSITGDVLVAVSDNRVTLWDTGQVRTSSTPFASFAHAYGAGTPIGDATFYASSASPSLNEVFLGNHAGAVVGFLADGSDAPNGVPVAIPGGTSSMQVQQIAMTPQDFVLVAMAGFNGPRAGVLAILDPARATADRMIFSTPVAGVGLNGGTMALDPTHGTIYTNAMVDTQDPLDPSRQFRNPVLKAPYPAGTFPRLRISGCR